MENILEVDGQKYDAETGELINEVEQVEVELVEDSLPEIVCVGGTHIKTNTEQLKKELLICLEKYDAEVTEDTEKYCSKMATELNKLAGDLDKKRKATATIIKKPADDLKSAIDELISIIQAKRTNILNGVEVFKQKRFSLIRKLLNEELKVIYADMKVSAKYQVVDVEFLVNEGSLAKTKLSKKAIEALESKVRRVKQIEDSVTIRTLQLEITCNKLGMSIPLSIDEVEHIIQDDDYDTKLESIIKNRLELEEKMKAKIEADAKQKQLEEELRAERLASEAMVKEQITGKKTVKFVATFEVEVSLDVDELVLINKYETKLKEVFPKSLKMVTPF